MDTAHHRFVFGLCAQQIGGEHINRLEKGGIKDVATGTLVALGMWLLVYFFTLGLGYLVEWISLNRWCW
jgi:hypothetical protein